MPTATPAGAKRAAVRKAPAPKAAELPDIDAMERFVAAGQAQALRATEAAQSVMYDAWDAARPATRIRLARKALSISPLCADAFVLLGQEEATTPLKALRYHTLGVAAGERALGPKLFEEYEGEFWGWLETRPYMRARHCVALALIALDRTEEAEVHCRDMLRLNPGDNQGIRYLLLRLLLDRDDGAAADALMARYEDEISTEWCYAAALRAFQLGQGDGVDALRHVSAAMDCNRHVPALLAKEGRRRAPSAPYIALGSLEEARLFAVDFGAAWHRTPGAVSWLVERAAAWTSPPPHRGRQPD